MPANGAHPGKHILLELTLLVEGGVDILSMQDIDMISKDLILPSLNMTKSTSFTPNFQH